VGPFSRVVRLPVPIEANQVEASLKAGVLTVTLPKAQEARPRKIEVKSA
jgi:HSP20 family protein